MGYLMFSSLPLRPRVAGRAPAVLAALSVAAWMGGAAHACPREVIDEAELLPGPPPLFQSGDSLIKDGVFAIALRPAAKVQLLRALDGEPAGYGGMVTFEGLPEARFALAFSQDARAQLVGHPDLRLIPLIERTRSGCGVVAEFFAHGGPVTFQVTGATAPTIVVVVRRLPDQTTWGKERQRRPAKAARRSPALS